MDKKTIWIYKFFICVLLLIGYSNYSYGKDAETVDCDISYFLDSTNHYTIQNIIFSNNFTPSKKDPLDFGFTQSAIWVAIDLKKNKDDLLITIENCHLDSIDIFFLSDNKLIKKNQSGDHLPFNSRYLENSFFNFLVEKGTDKIFIKIKTQGTTAIPIKLFSIQNYYNYYQSYIRYHWVYFGIVILTILSNLLFYFWLKESIYLSYVFCVLGIGIVTAVDFEYTFQFLWPNHPVFNNYNIAYYGVFIFTILFTDKLLHTRKNLPKIYPVFIFFYLLAASVVILSIFNQYNIAVKLILYSSPLIPVFCLLAGVLTYLKHRDHVVKFYLLGWTIYFVFMFLYLIAILGFIPLNTLTSNLLPVGSSFEIIFLNLAILSKINTLKQEKEKILSDQNRMLEEKVFERTVQLHEKNDEILTQNEEMLSQQTELEAQRDTLATQNRIIEDHNILLKGSKDSLEKLIEKRTDELKHTNQELIDYNHRLEQFAFVTAHNLRGPVATLLGLAQIYNREDITDPINLTILDKSNKTTMKLDEIIRDLVGILDLQKNSANLVQEVNINIVLDDVKILLSKEIEEARAVIEHNFAANTTINGVSAYINNIFYNLISNSIKYRRERIVPRLSIECIQDIDHITIHFKDNGRGIDLEKHGDKIFHLYKRFHLDMEGKGLG
ncbi:MAG TPA: 7TM diverse intracellular signaling domain-containing protein, partial [Cytophagaceae bacterium]|nr:7TM diverse intracellular signaling domain-containing protein [Cytophagaceae bacterium]